jgi:hypothetical protein
MKGFRFFWFIGVVIAAGAVALYFAPEIKFPKRYCIDGNIYVQRAGEDYLSLVDIGCKPLKEKPQ